MGVTSEYLEKMLPIARRLTNAELHAASSRPDESLYKFVSGEADELVKLIEGAIRDVDHELSDLKLARPRIKELEEKIEELEKKSKWEEEARGRVIDQKEKYLVQLKNVRDDGIVRCVCCGHDEEKIREFHKHMNENNVTVHDEPITEFFIKNVTYRDDVGSVRLCFWCRSGLVNQVRYDMLDDVNDFFNRSSLEIRQQLMELMNKLGGVPEEDEGESIV